ncbi:O-methyltransferase [Micromonospora sp. LOL_021]|uniref:O-methyltransferase n=1 Tax=Micromonospora sp. LOL_021 TaxID=3345417 RepID=UPI003A8B7108
MKAITIPGVEEYAASHTTADPEHLLDVATETHRLSDRPQMMIGPVEARFFQFYLTALRARSVLEIGTFTGYSALSMAAVMPADGHITTCELSPEHAEIALQHIKKSQYADRITVHVGPALTTLAKLTGPFDFILLDADQEHFPDYLGRMLELLAPGGVIAADNVLWSGGVIDESDCRPSTIGIRRFNDLVASRSDLTSVLLSIRDGIMLIRRTEGQ